MIDRSEDRQATASTSRVASGEMLSPTAVARLLFFGAALMSLAVSVYLFFSGDRERGIFVGLWVPSVLSAGALVLGGARDE
ncbi:MAG: hypothetical protein QNK03_19860 [Myxococcota bacterium]|nr:hypothetical protein [Myxococcota bacterium]